MLLGIGADVEEFLSKDGEIVSAIGLIGGTKEYPRWVQYGNLQEDNVLAEYAINPCSTEDSFIEHVQGLRKELSSCLEGYYLVPQATHVYDRDTLIGFGKQALEFGCSAEFCAWSEELLAFSSTNTFTSGGADTDIEDRYRSMSPSPYTELRSAGGHVHFSYPNPNDRDTIMIVRVLDYLLGTWSVIHDTDTARRSLYGKAGSCRIKSYGGEYRALSNFWVQSEEYIRTVYRLTELAVRSKDSLFALKTIAQPEEVQSIINSYDRSGAERVHTEAYHLLKEAQ